jgi:hypothetical protein
MAASVEIDTLQGTLDESVWFHLDLTNDVLYLRNEATRGSQVFGEETPDGFTVLRTDNGSLAGMTIVNYWRRFGSGELSSASIRKVRDRVAGWAQKHFVWPE